MHNQKILIFFLLIPFLFPLIVQAQTEQEINDLIIKYDKLNGMGKYQEAIPIAQQLVKISEHSLGPDHPDPATSLSNLGSLYYAMGNYNEAAPLLIKVLGIREKNLDPNNPDIAISLSNLGSLYRTLGDYSKAAPLIKRALEIREKVLGPEHPDTAISLNNLGYLNFEIGNYIAAEPLYKRALQIREKIFGLDHTDTANSLRSLAVLYQAMGNYAEAESLYKRSLQIEEKTFGQEHPNTATTIDSLAVLYSITCNYDEAEMLFKRAIAIRKKILGLKHPDTATSFHNLGYLYQDIGDYAKAEVQYKNALQIWKKALGQNHPDVALSYNNLAAIYFENGNYAAAESFYEQSLKIRLSALGPNHPDTVASQSNLAFLWLKTGKIIQAIDVFKKQNCILGLGRCYLAQGNFQQAKLLFTKEFEKPYLTDQRIGLSIGIGLACEGEKNYVEAKKWFGNAINLIEEQRSVLNSIQREHFLEGATFFAFRRIDAYDGMIRVLLQENGPDALRSALRYAEMIKSRIFFEMLSSRGLKSAKPEDEKVLKRDRDFQHRLITIQKRMEIIGKPGVILPSGEVEQVKGDLEKTQAEYEAFLNEVRLKHAEVVSVICALPADPAAMQANLDDDVTVLEYYTAQDRTYAWLITKNSVRLHEIKKNGADLTAKNLQADVAGLIHGNITGKTRRPAPIITLSGDQAVTAENAKQAREDFNKKAKELYNLMVAPLEADIKTKKLVIVPHDVLHKVPFACLTDGNKTLVDKYDLSSAPASSLIEFIVKKRKTGTGKFLAFANPATDKISLPFAEREVQSVENMFASKQVFSRADATKARLTSLSGDFDVVHFACHGEFNDMQPLQSGLLLAQEGDDDGVLRVPDVFGLNLQKANLVTLSACETALSKVRGGEDWAGMSRGFIYAGTPSILATLWSVDDKSTSILMKSFYENWLQKGMSKPAALRQAQLSLKAMPEYRHPFYWAPFVMIGDWR